MPLASEWRNIARVVSCAALLMEADPGNAAALSSFTFPFQIMDARIFQFNAALCENGSHK
jgi:hypothetical protein